MRPRQRRRCEYSREHERRAGCRDSEKPEIGARLEPRPDVGASAGMAAARRTWFRCTAGQTSLFPALPAYQGAQTSSGLRGLEVRPSLLTPRRNAPAPSALLTAQLRSLGRD